MNGNWAIFIMKQLSWEADADAVSTLLNNPLSGISF